MDTICDQNLSSQDVLVYQNFVLPVGPAGALTRYEQTVEVSREERSGLEDPEDV